MRFAQICDLCSLEDRAGAIQGCDCSLMSNVADADCDPSELKRDSSLAGSSVAPQDEWRSSAAGLLFGGGDVSRRSRRRLVVVCSFVIQPAPWTSSWGEPG